VQHQAEQHHRRAQRIERVIPMERASRQAVPSALRVAAEVSRVEESSSPGARLPTGAHARILRGARWSGRIDLTQEFDVVCLGGGVAAEAIAAGLQGSGLTLAVVERELVGGGSARTGAASRRRHCFAPARR